MIYSKIPKSTLKKHEGSKKDEDGLLDSDFAGGDGF